MKQYAPLASCGIAPMRNQVTQRLDISTLSDSVLRDSTFAIVGGVSAPKGYYPWQVAIYNQQEFLCGGSLINDVKVLTAAHCFNHRSTDVKEYEVVLGEHNRAFDEGINYFAITCYFS